jgi:hypothetical protein
MRKQVQPRLTYLLFFLFCSCSLFFQTVRIEVPKGYIGWVYVIPVNDTTDLQIRKLNGKYQINNDGIAYVPATALNIKKDSRVLVFESNQDISADVRYAGSVYSVKRESNKYEYIQFYLPSLKERKIADGTQYWRDKAWEYGGRDKPKFDSLLEAGKIVFK